ncbi:MAG: HNH endonuclease [Fluviibacter sp.]
MKAERKPTKPDPDALTPKQQRFVDEYLINVDRFLSYIDQSGGAEACWEWSGCKDESGYGRFHVGKSRNSQILAHRAAYGIATGENPEAVCHSCDNPSCCNPAHLFGGTRDDNNKDMARKRRHWLHANKERATKGEKHGRAKLDDQKVLQIQNEYNAGGITQRALAAKYSVSQRTINKVVTRTGWSHVHPDHLK